MFQKPYFVRDSFFGTITKPHWTAMLFIHFFVRTLYYNQAGELKDFGAAQSGWLPIRSYLLFERSEDNKFSYCSNEVRTTSSLIVRTKWGQQVLLLFERSEDNKFFYCSAWIIHPIISLPFPQPGISSASVQPWYDLVFLNRLFFESTLG